ncbi:hypothetical protein [Streptomyces sp. NBC_01477]|uniref:hypothetical protein n=1 Tax=Streptomyces sp. NBC_01477 TaxID=2976015 RepID=UPI002E306AC1|nr:hypothetical protein [Streptomyces sp. NBC_01477]
MEITNHRTTRGGDADQWSTLAGHKTVLVPVHTEVYGHRLKDLLPLLHSDLRVEVTFTVAPHAFNNGVARFLTGLGANVMPWAEAVRTDFDLAIAAGSQGMEKLRAPLVRIPHGGGHMSLARVPSGEQRGDLTAGAREPGGITGRGYLTWDGAVVPRAVALPHRDDLRALRRWCPEALPVAKVVGDPTYDRIAASLPFRDEYRAAIGLAPGQQLVLVPSTWGRRSSFNRLDALLPRLLAELPRDRFLTALLVHPNTFSRHGRYQVRAWLADCRRAGVTVVSPDADWRAMLVAAHFVLGDFGSVTLYATMTGAPIVLARYPYQDANPASPGVAMARTAPALSPTRPLADQLAYAAAEYSQRDFRRIAGRISSEPGRFARNMRALIYEQLGLGQPAYPPTTEPVTLSASEVAL